MADRIPGGSLFFFKDFLPHGTIEQYQSCTASQKKEMPRGNTSYIPHQLFLAGSVLRGLRIVL